MQILKSKRTWTIIGIGLYEIAAKVFNLPQLGDLAANLLPLVK